MSVVTLEGIVEKGQIRVKSNLQLPEKAKVYVVIPELQIERYAHIFSPRLANPAEIEDFKMEVSE